jgi:hypothetical protein
MDWRGLPVAATQRYAWRVVGKNRHHARHLCGVPGAGPGAGAEKVVVAQGFESAGGPAVTDFSAGAFIDGLRFLRAEIDIR